MAEDNLPLLVRIVKVDYYLTKPLAKFDDPCYSGFRSLPIHHVPVIRVFGPTTEGTKTCVHLHGVFPYIYIPNWDHKLKEKDFYPFAASLDKAINTSLACSSSKTCHVHRINAVSRRPYYGYYEDEKEFLKIEFYNPALLKRASDLLLNGAIFNQNYQPYEAHVPYILQFFIDNNLYGMSHVTFSSWQIRSETAKDVVKQTKMSFEVDTSVKHVIRQCLGGDGMPNNPGLAFIWDEERKRKKLLKGESQITPNASQARPSREATRTELYYAHKLREKLKCLSRKSSNAESTPDTVDEEMPEEELNSEGLDILAVLDELAAWNKPAGDEESASSRCSSPSIVFSDNGDESQDVNLVSNLELIRSQPVLKQTAEENSILGDDFSDDEIDREDHLLLSHSMYQLQSPVSTDDESDGGEVGNIPQLDGTDDTNTGSSRQARRERKMNGYNLRSVNAESRKSKDRKSTPKKQYPQLEIATQISPKRPAASPLVTGSPNSRPAPEASFLSTLFPDPLCSPTTTSPKSESRRSYPPLDLNFRKSPRSDMKQEPVSNAKRRKMMGGVKKRKINFDVVPKNDDTDTLLTTRWKTLQRSKKLQRSSPNRERNNVGEVRLNDIEDLSNLTCIVKGQNKPSEYVLPVNSEIDSQQYNLKIRFDACGSFDRETVLNSLLTKEPVVMVEKLKRPNNYDPIVKSDDEMVFSDETYYQVRESVSERKEDDIVTARSTELDEDQREKDVSKLDKAFRALSAEFSDGSSDDSASKVERCRIDNALAQPSKFSHSDEVSSAEVNFWDLGESQSPSSEKPNSAFSETIIASSSEQITQELDDEIERAQIPSLGDEFLSEFATPDLIDLEASEFGAIDRETVLPSNVSRRNEAGIERRPSDSNVHKSDSQRSLKTTKGFDFQDESETFVRKRKAALKLTECDESIAAPRNSSTTDDEFRGCRVNDDSDPEIFSQSSEEYRALAKSPFPLAGDSNSSSPANVADAGKSRDGQRFAFDNSAWDTAEKTSNEGNEVLSFYVDDTISVVNATIDCDKEADDVEVSTPENVPGILSWNAGDSLPGERSTDEDSRNKLSGRLSRETSSNDDLPPAPKKCLLSSTPRNTGKKTTPSPTYTPILKKLLLKKMSAQKVDGRSRPSSLRFQQEPFLADIGEEGESKDHCDVTKKDFPLDATTAAMTAEKNTSGQKSVSGGGSGLIDLTMTNTYGFRMSLENLQNVKTETKHQHITVLSMELFAMTRGNLCPDPELDAVHCIFYSIFHDSAETPKLTSGVIVVADDQHSLDLTRFNCEKQFVPNENDLLDRFIALVEKWDPDIFVGYEIEMLSWGYIIQRAQYLGRNYVAELSRVKEEKSELLKEKTLVEDNEYSDDLKLVGRIVLNVWRLMRHEITLQSYTFENILFHVLHQRVPKHSFRVLTDWWKNSLRRWIVIDYYLLRAESNITLLQQLDFFGRTSELARLFGIQFYEVLSRGSQFRVESMMLRLAKKHNFVAVSPSVKQRAKMRAPESLPLIMEPESKFYTDPVLVLDFQSLYPSIIIAYNYCFSTCLGRVEHLAEKETFNLGCIQHTVPAELLSRLLSSVNISPCGVAFVKQEVRAGILPDMLDEILNTRLMVKKSMKENSDDKTLQRVLHARQLGLKLIANVTYGYTSANFSGRMPCIEVGDSVVSKGRETLERAIEMVTKTEKWAAKVIYGDTDSLFVILPGRTKEEAFRIGAEIAEAVTNDNPKPVKLKFEKVYYPCILQTKKRYVGYMYESLSQKEPIYDAKGIETVRRDGCPAVSKILEKSLRLLFEHNDVNRVKQYVQRQFAKLVSRRLSIQELTFAREYRGMNNYKPAACVPALQLARRAILRDRRSEPRVKERVRYVLTVGAPGVPLIKSVCTPEEFLSTPGAIINAEYYITRAITPALQRCFSLMNVDVKMWYTELPRKRNLCAFVENSSSSNACKKTISHYFTTSKCVACEEISVSKVCANCQKNPRKVALTVGSTINTLQRRHNYLQKICRSCASRNDGIECSSLDCAVYYSRHQAARDAEQVPRLEKLQQTFLRCSDTNDR